MTPLLLAALIVAAPEPPPRDKLRLGVEYRWWGRNYQVDAPSDPSLAEATVGPMPTGLTFDIQWFPASHFVDDRRADVGVTLRADVAPEFISNLGGTSFRGSINRMRTGLMFRLPFEHVEPSVHLGFHAYDASFADTGRDGSARPRVPNLSLTGPRLALELRLIEFWRVTLDVQGGATLWTAFGEADSQKFFPGVKGNAFDVTVGLAMRTWAFLDIRLGVDVSVTSLSYASGVKASDAYYGVTLGFVFKGVPLHD